MNLLRSSNWNIIFHPSLYADEYLIDCLACVISLQLFLSYFRIPEYFSYILDIIQTHL